MAADFIKVNRQKVHGDRIVMVADKLIELRSIIATEYESSTHMFDGDDFSKLEETFGLEAGTGLNFYVLLGQLTDVLVGTGNVAGPERKARLDEFTARLGGQ